MKTRILPSVLLALAAVVLVRIPLGAGEVGKAKPTRASPEQIKAIKGVLQDLCNKGEEEDAVSTYEERISGGEQLLEIGAPAVPYMVDAINSRKTPFATKLSLVTLLGNLGAYHEADVTAALCSMLQEWVTNTKYSKGGAKMEVDGVTCCGAFIYLYNWSLLPCEAAKALAQTADPKAVPFLLKMMNYCRPRAEPFYTQERKTGSIQFASDVMTEIAIALAMTEDNAARAFIDKAVGSSSPSLRVKSNLGRTMSLLKENRETAQEYLRARIDEEKNTIAVDEYKKFLDRNCMTEQERKAELEKLREKLRGKPKSE